MSKKIKIADEDLMSFEDFSKLSDTDKKKVDGRTRIIALEKIKNNAEYTKCSEIRNDLLEFANEEIIPLITDLPKAKADEKAFFIALRFFMIHDIRLQSEMTLEAIAIILGITRERVRQIESNATRKLKHPKVSRIFTGYLNLGDTAETVGF